MMYSFGKFAALLLTTSFVGEPPPRPFTNKALEISAFVGGKLQKLFRSQHRNNRNAFFMVPVRLAFCCYYMGNYFFQLSARRVFRFWEQQQIEPDAVYLRGITRINFYWPFQVQRPHFGCVKVMVLRFRSSAVMQLKYCKTVSMLRSHSYRKASAAVRN